MYDIGNYGATLDQVLGATMVADPLTVLHCSPITDGAAAAILVPGDYFIINSTLSADALTALGFAPERDGLVWPGLVAAYQRALLATLHPGGGVRRGRPPWGRARRLWITREALLARYGYGAARPPEALDR